MQVEIVTHCYRYPQLLRYHLSSLVLHPPPMELDVVANIFFAEEDTYTVKVLQWFSGIKLPNVKWKWSALPVLYLCRRSIGRNLAALASPADWVWFCDVDYWFRSDCWEFLNSVSITPLTLIFPRYIHAHLTKELGDKCIAAAKLHEGLIQAPEQEFSPYRIRRAIGGVQIANGSTCRKRGYLRNSARWQQPSQFPIFNRCLEDVYFRRDLGTSGTAIDIPGVFRIRHSQVGRTNGQILL